MTERIRAKTENMSRLSRGFLRKQRELYPPSINESYPRPQTSGECGDMGGSPENPCPYVGCVHHLYIDVSEDTGSIKFNFPDKELDELEATCSLKVAERGGINEAATGKMINIVREGAGIILDKALAKMKVHLPQYREYVTGDVTRGTPPEKIDFAGVRDTLIDFLQRNDPTYGPESVGGQSVSRAMIDVNFTHEAIETTTPSLKSILGDNGVRDMNEEADADLSGSHLAERKPRNRRTKRFR